MKSDFAREILENMPETMKNEIKIAAEMLMNIEKIIEDAYKLYMPQVKSEILDLTNFILYEMKGSDPYNILEIGTKYGGTFYIWNKLIQEYGMGKCISIDMSDGGLHGGISEADMDKRDLWFQERFDDCHFIRGNSHDMETLSRFLQEINVMMFDDIERYKNDPATLNSISMEKIDFLFIDGDHTYDGVRMDFDMYSPLVKKGGCIAFHDIVISERHHERDVYVGEFWDRVTELKLPRDGNRCAYGGEVYEIHEFVEPGNDWAGIGLLKKL